MKLKPEIHREWTDEEKLTPYWIPEDICLRYVRDAEDALDVGAAGEDLPTKSNYFLGGKYYLQSPDFSDYHWKSGGYDSDEPVPPPCEKWESYDGWYYQQLQQKARERLTKEKLAYEAAHPPQK